MRLGTTSLGDLLAGSYKLLWVSTPMDWYVRTPGKRAGPHWDRLCNFLRKSKALRMHIIMFGPPGYIWHMGPVRDTIQELKLHVIRMRLCSLNIRYNASDMTPSGSYIQVATTCSTPHMKWACVCSKPIKEHVLDWYGQTQPHAEWRARVRMLCASELLGTILHKGSRQKESTYLMTHVRVDKDTDRYVTTDKGGPLWDTVVRRVTVNTDTGTIIQDIWVKDQPTGYDWHSPLPEGVRNIQTRLYWQPAEPTMLGNEQTQQQLGNEREARPKLGCGHSVLFTFFQDWIGGARIQTARARGCFRRVPRHFERCCPVRWLGNSSVHR